MVGIFARTLARFPVVVLLFSGCFCITLTLIGFLATDWPDFSNPILGFNTTGTDISNKLLALHNLQNEIGVGKTYYQFPSEIPKRPKTGGRKEQRKEKKNLFNNSGIVLDNKLTQRLICHDGQCNRTDKNEMEEPVYCRINFSSYYAHLVFEIDDMGSYELFSKLCDIETKFWMPSNIQLVKRSNCAVHSQGSCCQPWHLGSVAASLSSKTHCSDVNETDFETFKNFLTYCSSYKKFILKCWESDNWELCSKGHIPFNCSSQDYYFLYNFLLSSNFHNLTYNDDSVIANDQPMYTLIMLPVAKQAFESEEANPQLIKNLQKEMSKIKGLRLVAMDLGLRDIMFMDYLLMDTIYGALAMVFVLVSMWLYTGSLAFTSAAVIGIFMSMGVAYFIYRIIFINFFPFMNLLTFVLMVGLGADDTFIYRSAWTRAKSKKHAGTLPKVVSDTLAHAAVAMFVTSLTTSAAFFSNFLSHIVVVKCFGVFAGITVLTNYIVVITWLPAAVILIEKYDCSLTNRFRSCSKVERQKPSEDIDNNLTTETFVRNKMEAGLWCLICWNPIVRCYNNFVDIGKIFIEKLLPWLVIKFRYLWIISLGGISIVAAVAVFHYPGLRLPDKDYFQYFKSRHPFERWESELKQKFAFSANIDNVPMLSRVVWGVGPTLDSAYLNPDDHGSLNVWSNGSFEFNSNLALVWLREFCSKMAVENFTLYEPPMMAYCYIHDFMEWMNGPCIEPDKKNRTPCCNENPFPYPPNVFDVCLKRAMAKFPNDIQRSLMFTSLRNGPFFTTDTHQFSLLTVAFPSTFNFTLSFQEMDDYYNQVSNWVNDQLAKGPWMVRNGWFISEQLQFYDLQKALLNGTQVSVAVAVAIAFGVLFLTTLNPLISLLAIISISSVIFSTIACLILLDWELNVLESTIIILTIGLSFDFTLHYGVSYKLGTEADREARVICILSWTGGPVFMAMITTFLAGLAMMPSTTLAYFQIGLFMMIVTLISWVYATFFFCSLLYVVGPTGDQCQFRWSSLFSRRSKRFSKDMTGRKMSVTRHISSTNSPCKVGAGSEFNSEIVELEPMFNDEKDSKLTSVNPNRRNIKERSAISVRRASMPVIRGIPSYVEQTNNGNTRHRLTKRMQSDLTTNRVAIASNRV